MTELAAVNARGLRHVRESDWPISHDDEGGLIPCLDVPPVFAGLVSPGKVLFQVDPEPFRAAYLNKLDLADALGQGYYVTLLSASSRLGSFARGMDGVSVSASQVAQSNALTASIAHLDFQGWGLARAMSFSAEGDADQKLHSLYWEHIDRVLGYRSGKGFLFCLTDLGRLLELGVNTEAILRSIEKARAAGSAVVVCANDMQELHTLQSQLVPDHLVRRIEVTRSASD